VKIPLWKIDNKNFEMKEVIKKNRNYQIFEKGVVNEHREYMYFNDVWQK